MNFDLNTGKKSVFAGEIKQLIESFTTFSMTKTLI